MLKPLLVRPDEPGAAPAAARSGADTVVLDLGDGDAPGDRGARRRAALAWLEGRRAGVPRSPRAAILRTAGLRDGPGTTLLDADLDVVMAGAPDAVWLPGCVGGRDLQQLGAKLAVREAERGLAVGGTRVVAAPADTPAGVLALAALPGATARLLALVWDPAALAAALGTGADASPVRDARDRLLIAAAAANVPAFDRGMPDDDLAAACRAARRDGFAGRIAREPDEVAAIAAVFRGLRRSAETTGAGRAGGRTRPILVRPISVDQADVRAGLAQLRAEAAREGFAFLERLVTEWDSGANRFDRGGECLLGVFVDACLVGLGGINRDPAAGAAPVARLRRLYVLPEARGRGIGAALVAELVAAARRSFDQIRLQTDSADAAAFYAAQGFERLDGGSATHGLRLRRGSTDP